MTPDHQRYVAEAMISRSRQWKVRMGMAVAIAAIFFSVPGPGFTILWLAIYAWLQAFETQLRPQGRLYRWLGETRYTWACLMLIVINNAVFSAFGAQQMATGTLIGLVCGPLLLGGAFLNAVMVNPGSRHAMIAAATPQLVYVSVLPVGALAQGFTPLQAIQVTLAAILLLVAGIAAWVRLFRTVHALERAQSEAEDANRAKSDFLATISHEIRTPLNGVLGMAQAMAADQLAGRQRERLDVITQSGQTLLSLLNDVLDLAKIEARKIELEDVSFDLESLVEGSQQTFRAIADSKGLAFETHVDPSAVGVWRGDVTRLRQILSNLISNAVKFTDEGRVRVTAIVVDGNLRFVVEDTGPGVTPEQLPRLFEKFVQADTSTTRRYGGTGLGLSICGELAQMMGGSITAEHVQPHGLRFTFEAPVMPSETRDHPLNPGMPTSKNAIQDMGAALRVLAAEDHPVNRQVLTLLLSQVGIIPHIVENGAEAVEAWREGAPDGEWDLILMDVQMPVMDGPTAARRIRAEERETGRTPVPIIALTANVMTHQIEDYRQAGMETFVAKPIQVEALLAGLQTALVSTQQTQTREDERAA